MSAGTVRQIHAILWLWLKSRDDNARRPPSHASQAPLVTAGDGWHGGVVCPYPHLAGVVCPNPHYPAGTAAVTIQICTRAILSGALVTAVRWEWITRNPAASAKLPRNRRQ